MVKINVYIAIVIQLCNGHGDCEEDSSNDSFQCNCDTIGWNELDCSSCKPNYFVDKINVYIAIVIQLVIFIDYDCEEDSSNDSFQCNCDTIGWNELDCSSCKTTILYQNSMYILPS